MAPVVSEREVDPRHTMLKNKVPAARGQDCRKKDTREFNFLDA
jgi:hypothetical protein